MARFLVLFDLAESHEEIGDIFTDVLGGSVAGHDLKRGEHPRQVAVCARVHDVGGHVGEHVLGGGVVGHVSIVTGLGFVWEGRREICKFLFRPINNLAQDEPGQGTNPFQLAWFTFLNIHVCKPHVYSQTTNPESLITKAAGVIAVGPPTKNIWPNSIRLESKEGGSVSLTKLKSVGNGRKPEESESKKEYRN